MTGKTVNFFMAWQRLYGKFVRQGNEQQCVGKFKLTSTSQ